jgi:beta-lactamase regulating signal transducer with metallopeptidase domain
MNPLLHWLNAPEWTQLVAALLHSLWQGALLAILLAVLLRRLTQPRLRYYASLGTLGILVLASIITWAVLTEPKTNGPVAPAPLATESAAAPTFAPTLNLDSPDKVIAFGTPISPAPPTVPWTAWLAMVWMLGTFVMLLRAGIKVAGAEKLRRSCQPLTDETMTLLVVEACCAINLVRKIRVAVTDQLTSPAVVGILVPTLILPLSLFTTLTPEQIRFILLHELAHIRRGDYLANLFQLLAEALLFFNPAVWWLSHHIRREREACCDALAIELSGAPADYAKTLVRVAENTLPPAPTTALAFGEDGREPSSLADRVQRLLVPGYRPALRLTWRAMLTSLFVGGTLLFLSAVGTRNTVGAILATDKPLPNSIGNTNGGQFSEAPAIQFKVLAGNLQTNGTTLLITNSARIKFDEQVEETEVAADVITIENGVLTAQGNVRIAKANFVTTGQDWSINMQSRRVVSVNLESLPAGSDNLSRGNAPLETTNEILSGRELRINRNSNSVTDRDHSIKLHKPTIQAIGQVSSALPRDLEISSVPPIGMPSSALSDYLAQDGFLFHPPATGIANWVLVTNGHLKKQWFYYRIGRVGEVQLSERTFNVDPVKLQDAVRKAAAAPASVNRNNFASALRNYFLQAGINFDPNTGRSFYLNDSRGQMLIRATATELDAIGKLLEPMRGGEPLERRTYHVDSNQLAQVVARLPAALRQIMATNPAAGFQAILESFNSEDPRPKQVRAFPARNEFTARATAEDFSQFETLLGISALPTDQLLTREYKLPVEFVNQRILTNIAPARPTANTSSNQQGLVHQALRDWFTNAAVDLNPNQGKGIVYNDRAGIVLARATTEELDKIESAIRELMWQPPQIHLKVRWVEAASPMEIVRTITPTNIPLPSLFGSSDFSGVLNADQTKAILNGLRSNAKLRLLSEGSVITTTDRQAQIQVAETKTIVAGIDPRALTPPGISSTFPNSSDYLRTESVPFGPVIDVLPAVELDQQHISVRAIATLTEFAGYEPGAPEVPIYVNGKKAETTLPLPRYHVRQMTNTFTIADGQTFYFGTKQTAESAKQADGTYRITDITAQQTNHLVVFITAMIIDPTGIPANRDLGLPSKPILPSQP